MTQSQKLYDVYSGNEPYLFISYSHENEKQVMPILNHLSSDYRVWYDEGVQSTSKFLDYIGAHLLNSNCVIAFLSEDYYVSDYCKSELTFALEHGIPVAIVNLDGSTPPVGMQLQLAGQFSLDFQKYVDMSKFLSKLTAPEVFNLCKKNPSPSKQQTDKKEEQKKAHKEQEEEKKKPSLLIGVIAAIILLVAALVLLPKISTTFIVSDAPNTETQSPESGYTNLVTDSSVISSETIKSITFLDSLANMPESYWKASEMWNNDVYAWAYENNGYYDIYYAAAGGVEAPESCTNLFKDLTALEHIEFHNFDTSHTKDMSGMFAGCINLTDLNVENFDTSNVTNMSYLFYGCTRLENLSIEDWNVKNVTDFHGMFSHCESLKDLDLHNWNTIKAYSMADMFRFCYSLASLDVSGFKTHNLVDMSYMFADCSSLTSLSLNSFNTSKVVSMEGTFCKMTSLTALDISHFDVSRVKNMRSTFWYMNLKELDVSSWKTLSLEDARYTFMNCPNLTPPDVSGWDFSNVTQHDNFMDDGVLINGQPWQTLFPS